jgi:hypothetical protein
LRTTVYKRDLNRNYNLKSKASRSFFNEVMNRFPALCFSMRAFEDEIVKINKQNINKTIKKLNYKDIIK